MQKKAPRVDPDIELVSKACNLQQSGRFDEAESIYRKVLQKNPKNPDALHLLGLIEKRKGNLSESIRLIEGAIKISPAAFFYNNLGNTYKEAGLWDKAIECYRKALSLKPDYVEAYCYLGNILRDLGQLPEAMQLYEKAIKLAPGFADAHNDLGGAYQKQGLLNEAIASFRESLRLKPDFAIAHYNLGNALTDAGLLDQALEHLRLSVKYAPDYVEGANSLLRLLQTICLFSDELDQLSERFIRWGSVDGMGKVFPFSFLAIPSTLEEQQKCARLWVKYQYRAHIEQGRQLAFVHSRQPHERIRIGYLSSDLHSHATAFLMAELFELHDRKRFEVFAFSRGIDDGSPMRRRLIESFEHFVEMRDMPIVDAAKAIHAAGIDILIDLKGYTRDTASAIMALRPAPIQVQYIGYPGTMGADFIDYVVTDRFVTPPETAQFFDEKFAYLPHSYQCNDRRRAIAAPVTREAFGLPEKSFVFCCFNHTYKISAEVFSVWCELLRQVPDSVLWLLKSNQWAEQNLKNQAISRGIDPNRLIISGNLPLDQHLSRLRLADLFLDTQPYNAHTTCSDALWAGLPVVTCAGNTFASRVAGSLLTAVGMPELITYSLADYQALALRIAKSPDELSRLKQKLKDVRDTAPLFDTPSMTKSLEALYDEMWQRYVQGQPPALLEAPDFSSSESGVRSSRPAVPAIERGPRAEPAERLLMQSIIDSVPLKSARILDLGCGLGGLGEALKQRQSCQVTGIESSKEAANKASETLDCALCGPASSFLHALPEHYYDAIIVEELLEQFGDVDTFLTEISHKLSASGRLILSAANVLHWRVIKGLLEGDVSLQRLLSRRRIAEALERNGFQILSTQTLSDSSGNPLLGLSDALNAFGIHVAELDEGMQCSHYVFTCEKKP